MAIPQSAEHARTTQELSGATGIRMVRIREALHQYQRAGRLQVHSVVRTAIDGRQSRVAAYTLSPEKRK